jgi:integrase
MLPPCIQCQRREIGVVHVRQSAAATVFRPVGPCENVLEHGRFRLTRLTQAGHRARCPGRRSGGKPIKYPEEKRERFLSPAELKRVGEVLREMETEGIELHSAIAAVRLLILTGCRLNEIMTLKWSYLDAPARAFLLPDSKTGGAKVVRLGQPALEVLMTIERVEMNPWVIVGMKSGTRLTDLQPFWQRVRARACPKDARIHDLRHTFASTAVASGQGPPMIGKLLGHTQVQTTARYAHLATDPVRLAVNSVSNQLAEMMVT